MTSPFASDRYLINLLSALRTSQSGSKRHHQLVVTVEKELQNRVESCPIPDDPNERARIISSLDFGLVKLLLDTEFYNIHLLEALFCLFHLSNAAQFQHLVEGGSRSVHGYVLFPISGPLTDAVVLKVPRVGVDLTHEYIVGVYGTNRLRRLVPNFAYVLGNFWCAAPQIAPNRTVLKWCTDSAEPNVSYIIYERIMGDSLRVANRCINFTDWLSYYLQIVFALSAAREINFRHNDLHDENVLLRPVPGASEVYIPYGDHFVRSPLVATIIDYGQAQIEYLEADLSMFTFESTTQIYSPLADLYRLLMFSLWTMYHASNPAFSEVAHLFSFFNDGVDLSNSQLVTLLYKKRGLLYDTVLRRYVRTTSDTHFALGVSSLTFEDFQEYILDRYGNVSLVTDPPVGSVVLHCENNCRPRSIYNDLLHLPNLDAVKATELYLLLQEQEKLRELTDQVFSHSRSLINQGWILADLITARQEFQAHFDMVLSRFDEDDSYFDELFLWRQRMEVPFAVSKEIRRVCQLLQKLTDPPQELITILS